MPPKYSEEIVKLFKARPRPRFVQHEHDTYESGLTGLAGALEVLGKIDLATETSPVILPTNERRMMKRQISIERDEQRITEDIAKYNPKGNADATGRPYNTIFLSGIDASVTEMDIRFEFEVFGRVRDIKFVFDQRTHQRRSYCFVEFEDAIGFANAMRHGTRLYMNKRRILVDCERGRTVTNWLPQRLGGGQGEGLRSFTRKADVLEVLTPRKKKRSGYRCGGRYRATLAEVSRKHEERYGIRRRGRRN